nr:MAG TPA: hypothetical protein [Bacteriophage sp.]
MVLKNKRVTRTVYGKLLTDILLLSGCEYLTVEKTSLPLNREGWFLLDEHPKTAKILQVHYNLETDSERLSK